ncbi:hypothetical protein BST61_g5981 [Cercospora zeina]
MAPPPPLEEQALLRFHEKQYYPMQLGQTLHNRYHIITKLGYGASSTVWLARDQETDQYTTIKVCVRDHGASVANEINVLHHLAAAWSDQTMPSLARLARDVFEVDGHSCIVMKAEACSLLHAHHLLARSNSRLPRGIIAAIVLRLLGCINWLHLECGVVHTEITTQNVLLSAFDNSFFQRIEQEESKKPSVPTMITNHHHLYPLYASRGQLSTISELSGDSTPADFGSAKFLAPTETVEGWWMPDTYRAPEILLDIPWSHAVDVWAIGIMVCAYIHIMKPFLTRIRVLELVEGRNAFYPLDVANHQYDFPLAMAQYVGYMGSPPLWMIQESRNPVVATLFDEEGQWTAVSPIPESSLEDFVTVLPPAEKAELLRFIRRILTWDPAQRATSAELFEDEWLKGPFV